MSEPTLMDRLRQSDLLPAETLDMLAKLPEASNSDPKYLGKVLFQRNLLTRYQINQVARGAGKDLHVGPYVLLDRLGEGGMGQVYKARHRHMNRTVALKVIRKEKLANADSVTRFYQEVQAAGQLHHANIVLAFDAGQFGPTHFFAMEYVGGPDLARMVKENGPLPVTQACEYIRQVADGLQHAHERGLVHRDIKPGNILVAPGEEGSPGTAKILDLGLARLADNTFQEDRGLTKSGQVLGTPDYLAPEQAIDAHQADARSDIYSLGCTLYYLLTGKPPFQANTLTELLLKHQMEHPKPLSEFRSDIPPDLEEVLGYMMAKRPEDRLSSAAQVKQMLEPFAAGSLSGAIRVAAPVGPAAANTDIWADISTTSDPASVSAVRKRGESTANSAARKRERSDPTLVAAEPKKSSQPAASKTGTTSRRAREEKRGLPVPLLIGIGAGALVLLVGVIFGIMALGGSGTPKKEDQRVVKEDGKKDREGEEKEKGKGDGPAPGGALPIGEARVVFDADQVQFLGHPGAPRTLAINSNDTHFASGGADGTLVVWDLVNRNPLFLHKHKSAISGLTFTGDNRLVVAAAPTVHEWDVEKGKEISKAPRTGTYLSPDGKSLSFATANGKQELVFRDGDGREVGRCASFFGICLDQAMREGWTRVALLAENSEIQIVDVGDRREVVRVLQPAGSPKPTSLAWGESDSVLLVGHADGGIRRLMLTGNPDSEGKLTPSSQLIGTPHSVPVTALAATIDGRHVLSGAEDGGVQLTALAGGTMLQRLGGHSGSRVTAARFLGDGRSALTAGADNAIRLWDLANAFRRTPTTPTNPGRTTPPRVASVTGQKQLLNLSGTIGGSAFAPTGKQAYCLCGHQIVEFDVETAAITRRFPETGPTLNRLALSADGKRALTADAERVVKCWDVEKGVLLKDMPGHEAAITALAFSSDGKYGLSAGGGILYRNGTVVRENGRLMIGDFVVRLWNLEMGKEEAVFTNESRSPFDEVGFSPDGKQIWAGGRGSGTLRLWDVQTKSRLSNPSLSEAGYRFTMVGQEKALFAGRNGALRLVDLNGKVSVKALGDYPDTLVGMAASPEAKRAAVVTNRSLGNGNYLGTLIVYDTESGADLGRAEMPVHLRNVSMSPDGKLALVSEWVNTLRILELDKIATKSPPTPTPTTPTPTTPTTPKSTPPSPVEGFTGHRGAVNSVAFSPNGRRLISGGADNKLIMWDAQKGSEVNQHTFTGPVKCVRFSRDGSLYMGVGAFRTATVWEAATANVYTTLDIGLSEAGAVDSALNGVPVAFSSDGFMNFKPRKLVAPKGMTYKRIPTPNNVTSIAYLGDVLFASGDASGSVILWNGVQGAAGRVMKTHKGTVSSMVFDAARSRLFSGGADGLIAVRVVQLGNAGQMVVFAKHTGTVTGLSVTPDGKYLASCGEDKNVCVWGTPVKRLVRLELDETPLAVAITPDGKRLAVGTDKGLRVYDVKVDGAP